jgi:hypothetical protein
LYKYKALEPFEHVADIICNNRFHTALFHELNDPMEGVFLSGPVVAHHYEQQIIEATEQTRICSFSRTWTCPVLWAQYADGFRGLCLEVEVPTSRGADCRVTERDVRRWVGDVLFASVDYSPVRYRIDTEQQADEARRMPNLLLEWKAEDWKLEQEVRAFSDDEFIQCRDGIRIAKILLGGRMEATMQGIIRRITPPSVPVWTTKVAEGMEIELDEEVPLRDNDWKAR